MNEFIKKYRNFVETGIYNLSLHNIPEFLRLLTGDIAKTQGRIKDLRNILKIENLPPRHPRAEQMRFDIEYFNDYVKICKRRKAQLIKLKDKLSSKKSNQDITGALNRPMIKRQSDPKSTDKKYRRSKRHI